VLVATVPAVPAGEPAVALPPLPPEVAPPESDCEHAAHTAKQTAPNVPTKAHRDDDSIFMHGLLG